MVGFVGESLGPVMKVALQWSPPIHRIHQLNSPCGIANRLHELVGCLEFLDREGTAGVLGGRELLRFRLADGDLFLRFLDAA